MNATLAPTRAQSSPGRTTFAALALRELRRFVVNPLFLFAVVFTAWTTWGNPSTSIVDIDEVNSYPAIFLGGFGMMTTFWLTRSMRHSEPVVGVTPTGLPMRSAALCTVAVVPFLCGVLTLFAFLHYHPLDARVYGAFSASAQVAVLVGQIVLPTLGGPLLGVALGRWVRFPGAAFVALLFLFGWGNLSTVPSLTHPDSTSVTALRMFAPFTHFTLTMDGTQMRTWPGSPWWFIGWQLALCAIAVLVALLRGADGRARVRIVRTLPIVLVLAAIMFALAVGGGFTHTIYAR
jgi:hypothetical protein